MPKPSPPNGEFLLGAARVFSGLLAAAILVASVPLTFFGMTMKIPPAIVVLGSLTFVLGYIHIAIYGRKILASVAQRKTAGALLAIPTALSFCGLFYEHGLAKPVAEPLLVITLFLGALFCWPGVRADKPG
ncbi:hypothetical protein [Pseudoduganella namucuonensis]|uniref:Uncharacterized protein n=1 Tax=Pseudoduganella namucuonensis TaxID=1035707 RepID=A0A1I7LG06_9BURK|nr:hypothetical protein [Pseudoduganella namucuonensis]SFV08582.1 hypothetical protein SAMN05216552_102895 [Pseudoduganella namucuonensis]